MTDWISNLTHYEGSPVAERTLAITAPFTDALINAIFNPLDSITPLLDELLDENGDLVDYLTGNWQSIANQQIGLVAAIVIGLLYVVLVPLAGFIVACSECCCLKKCQSNSKCCSCCGLFDRIATGLLSLLVLLGGVLVLVANSHTEQAIKSLPNEFKTTTTIPSGYLTSVKGQLDSYFDDYVRFTNTNMDQLTDEQIGNSAKFIVEKAVDPVLNEITTTINDVDEIINDFNTITTNFGAAKTEAGNLETSIDNFVDDNECFCDVTDSPTDPCPLACQGLKQFDATDFDAPYNKMLEASEDISNLDDLSTVNDEIDQVINSVRKFKFF